MSSNSNRNDYLDIVKGFAMILVILGHSMEASAGKEARANLSFFVDPVHDFIFSFHMPLFMLVSGWLFYMSLKIHDTRYLITSRLRSLLVPILTFGFLVTLLNLDYNSITAVSFLKTWFHSTTSNLWFLYAVLALSFLSLFIEKTLHGHIVCYMLITILTLFTPSVWWLFFNKEIAFMCPFFVIGLLFNKYGIFIGNHISMSLYVMTLLLSILLFVILFKYWDFTSYIYTSGINILKRDCVSGGGIYVDYHQLLIDVYRFAIGLIGSIMILLLIYGIRHYTVFPSTFLSHLLIVTGVNSMGMYCFHFIGTIWLERMSYANPGISYSYSLFCAFALYAFALFFTLYFKQWRYTRLLFIGGR